MDSSCTRIWTIAKPEMRLNSSLYQDMDHCQYKTRGREYNHMRRTSDGHEICSDLRKVPVAVTSHLGRRHGSRGGPACGDVMKLQIKVDEKTGQIVDARFKTFGCGSAIASSSVATEWVKGKAMEEVLTIKNT
ncbi:unnamed protein product [Brassica rapa]|uniref:NIF system FeS cluster assembly NifU N-terminal domain-containing protein n=1 Tax=Brassica campestris TaxID=3711 RepID=A0A8D9G5N6_BRACM|nr:unnamed protein product [Brassica rapa]